ncbi:MAG: alanine--glyoxylate aminotransferase family protein [Candidatus Melainabacteria bacterium]|nr:alanine--glyoxylate aminotransferase family protein [Candidatus Melainabacteria bacterium]
MQPREFLMIPGPTPVPDRVLEAVARHPIGHRTPEFSKLLRGAVDDLKWLGQTARDPYVITSSGTGAMEAAIVNTVNSGDGVLSLIVGVFGERWAKISEAYGAKVERVISEPGQPVDLVLLAEKLKKDKEQKIKVVTVTHNETSTGVINDLQAIAKLVRSHGALLIVDAVTSFGAVNLPIDEWQVDVLVTGSQKALMLPPGLGVIFFSERAWRVSENCKTPRFYLDLRKYKKSLEQDTTPATPNVSLVAGLRESLLMMREDGTEKIFARHLRLKEALRSGIKALGLKLFVADEHASPTITAILPPSGISVADIRKGLKEDFRILVADGQEELKGKIFRIGHMGYVFERDILMTLAALESVLRKLGHEVTPGKAVEAASSAFAVR